METNTNSTQDPSLPQPQNSPEMVEKAPVRNFGARAGLIGFLLAVLIMGGVYLYGQYMFSPTEKVAEVRIPKGAGASEVGQILEDAGVVRSGQLFALYLRFTGRDTDLRSGFYRVEGKGIVEVARSLTDKETVQLTTEVTFPEGWRTDQMANRLSQLGFDGVEFQKLIRQPPATLRPKQATGPSLEGFLFPATYSFPRDITTQDIVKAMTNRMAEEFKPDYQSTLAKLKLSIHDWVTLASIVQAEAANAAEMPVIAGIFLNRLELGQGLQSDPTVAYASGKDLPQLNRRAGDFEVDSPYNTYKYAGLPPGAIGNPGSAALQSILRSKRTNAKGQKLYYFLHAQGKIFVNVDFQSHLRDTARYR